MKHNLELPEGCSVACARAPEGTTFLLRLADRGSDLKVVISNYILRPLGPAARTERSREGLWVATYVQELRRAFTREQFPAIHPLRREDIKWPGIGGLIRRPWEEVLNEVVQEFREAFIAQFLAPPVVQVALPYLVLVWRERRPYAIDHAPWPDATPPRRLVHLAESGFESKHGVGILACPKGGDSVWVVSSLSDCEVLTPRDLLGGLGAEVSRAFSALQDGLLGEMRVLLAKQGSASPEPSSGGEREDSRYALRKGLGAWELVFDGSNAQLKQSLGLLYIACLLRRREPEPINAIDLAALVPEVYRRQRGIDHVPGDVVAQGTPLDAVARLQERSLRIDDHTALRKYREAQAECRETLEDPNAAEQEKAVALSDLDAITELIRKHCRSSDTSYDMQVKAVQTAIRRFHKELRSAVGQDGRPSDTLQAFADHMEQYILRPTARLTGGGRIRNRGGNAGCFVYERPAGVHWSD